jgi:Na+/proline symporter
VPLRHEPALAGLAERAPELLDWGYLPGLQGGLTLFIAILVTGLFHQGYWQRVYAVRDERTLRGGFLAAALATIPIVGVLGLFGLAAVGLGRDDVPSVALFAVLLEALPFWLVVGLIVLGLALVMSSADTVINAIASLVAVDLRRAMPEARPEFLLRASRWAVFVLAVPVLVVAAQGYSVLYLFLLADLLCAAAVFPVFYGLYSERYDGRTAAWSTAAGLVAGGLLFPDPAMTRGSLLGSFLLAAFVPVVVSLIFGPRRVTFDLGSLRGAVRAIRE